MRSESSGGGTALCGDVAVLCSEPYIRKKRIPLPEPSLNDCFEYVTKVGICGEKNKSSAGHNFFGSKAVPPLKMVVGCTKVEKDAYICSSMCCSAAYVRNLVCDNLPGECQERDSDLVRADRPCYGCGDRQ